MALTKVSGGILDPGINVVGIVTATGFDGPFTGGSSKNITAGIITATELDINGNGDISGNLVVGGNLTANGDFTTLNTTLREVELLRVNAQDDNVAAGIITQRGSGDILNLYDGSTEIFSVEDGGDIISKGQYLKIENSGSPEIQLTDTSASNSLCFIRNSSGNLRLAADNNNAVADTSIRFLVDGDEKMRIEGDNVGIASAIPSAKLDVIGQTNLDDVSISGVTTTTRLDISSTTPIIDLIETDGNPDYRIYAEGGEFVVRQQNPSVSNRLVIDSGGVNIPNNLNVTGIATGTIFKVPDATNASGATNHMAVGDNSDLKLYHDNSGDAYITNDTGHLTIRNDTSGKVINLQPKSGANGVIARYEGAAELYHNGDLKFATTADGAAISNIQNNGGLNLNGVGNNTCIKFLSTGSSPAHGYRIAYHSTTNYAFNSPSITFDKIATNGNFSNHVAAISDTGFHLPDNMKLHVGGVTGASGATGDLQLYHDASDSHIANTTGVFYIQNTGDLRIRVDNTDAAIHCVRNGAVEVHHAGNKKFETTSTGVHVTGEVSATQDYPNYRPTLDFNFAAEKKLDPRITYERTGPASFVNELGKLVIVGHNTPRFNHDPTTKECEGLLFEAQTSNRVIYSADYTQFPLYQFSSYEGVISENLGTAPDGSLTDAFVGQGNTGRTTLYVKVESAGAGLSNNTKYAMSIFVKRVSNHSNERYCKLETASYSTWTHSGSSGVFDLSNGTQVTSPSANITSGIETYPNGWFRIHFVSTTATVSGNTGFYVNMCDSSGNTSSTTLTGSQGLFLYGTQMEANSFPTSYIHTNGSVEIRGHDQVFIDGEDFTDFYNPVESTVVCQFDSFNWLTYNPQTYERIWSISNGSESDVFEMFKSNVDNNLIRYRVRDGGANVLGAANITYGTNTTPKIAFALKLNDAAVAVDGTITGTTDTGIPMPTPDRLILGNDDNSNTNSLHGHIRRFMYYPVKLPDSQVVTLTS